ncbi:alkaline phosphatase-like isoform X2 [Branchiostoma floridae]|uniref:Alkaline phosphatase, tissue-nonspecific isozyme n=1 Tax=Branchiostoma floridae TaxID=7739 RepID=A0A9J7MIQ1_BRAFL|nr:alkaline phosphatase-like isoform X2 [Branchiostoma floridae]
MATTTALLVVYFLLAVVVTVESAVSVDEHAHSVRRNTREIGGAPEVEKNPQFWNNMAKTSIQDALRIQKNHKTKVAKNVVLFLGDGMGVVTVTAARILKGQKAGNPGEETVLNMETLPHVALSKTYNIDAQTPEVTATAYLCGVKARWATLGLDGRARNEDCSSSKGREVPSVLAWAEYAGKSTGIVSTARVTHAFTAAAYAHTANRRWEVDSILPPEAIENGCKDISAQLVDDNPGIKVILVGGRRHFHAGTDPEYPTDPGSNGVRSDGRNLAQDWLFGKTSARYVWNGTDFRTINPQTMDYLLGSRIDHGHHEGKAVKAINEAVAFDDAVEVAKDLLNLDETLIVVTADHAHTVSLGGWDTARGSPIFGKLDPDYVVESVGDKLVPDGKPYTALQYGTGPGYNISALREDITNVNTANPDYVHQSAVPMIRESHVAEDVAIFADGPMAHLFHGVHEQNYIAHVMKYAACLGEYAEDCDREERVASGTARGSFSTAVVLLSIILQLAWV